VTIQSTQLSGNEENESSEKQHQKKGKALLETENLYTNEKVIKQLFLACFLFLVPLVFAQLFYNSRLSFASVA